MDLLRAWSTAIFKGIDYLSPCELDELRKSNLPITAEELKNIAHLSADDIYKAIEPTKTPKGPPGAKNGSEDTKVGNTKGLPKVSKDANGQAKTVASADAATVRKDTGESASERTRIRR